MFTPVRPSGHGIRYNFWRGHPNRHLLPAAEMQEILDAAAAPDRRARLAASLQYPGDDRGDPALRRALAAFLRRHTRDDEVPDGAAAGSDCDADLFLTHGVSHGLDLLCAARTRPGDVVLVERPSYFLAAGIFRARGLRLGSLPMTRRGGAGGALRVDVEALERGLRDGRMPVPRLVYLVPTHQNPTGYTMPVRDRWRLCRLARTFGFLLAADEVYHLLDWREDGKRRPARFSVLDRMLAEQSDSSSNKLGGCAVSVASFTKIFAPGVRCGWIERGIDGNH